MTLERIDYTAPQIVRARANAYKLLLQWAKEDELAAKQDETNILEASVSPLTASQTSEDIKVVSSISSNILEA